MTDVFLVDTNPERLNELKASLEEKGLRAHDAATDLSRLDLGQCDCLVCIAEPFAGPDDDVLHLAARVPCILLDYTGDARRAVAAMKAGAADYLVAPFTAEELAAAIQNRCATGAGHPGRPLNMVGFSETMTELFELIAKAGPTESAVLIEGESGTGKELVARALHSASRRNHAPLITLNCATTPEELIESELFGYPDSDASSRRGLLQAAHGGTLFLDEIGELPAKVQARLKQVLETGTVHDLDTGAAHRVDVRLISASHRNLKQIVENGLFRDDLFYRVNVVSLMIPPLRKRGDDVLRIAELFLERTTRKLSKSCGGLSDSAKQAMLAYDWPGNVRELENAIERAVILCSDGEISEALLAIEVSSPAVEVASGKASDKTSMEDYFVSFVTANQDRLTETELAQRLGISRKSLWERRQRLNMPRKRTRKRGPRRENP